ARARRGPGQRTLLAGAGGRRAAGAERDARRRAGALPRPAPGQRRARGDNGTRGRARSVQPGAHEGTMSEEGPSASAPLVVLTGVSGSGKTTALHALEDIGFYTVDNLPPALWLALVEGMPAVAKGLCASID